MKTKTLTALLFSTLVAATSLTVSAGPDRGHHGPAHGGLFQLKGLELTEAQKAEVKSLMEQHRAGLPAKAEMKTQHQQLKALVQAENFDEASVRATLESQQKQRLEAEISRARLQHAIYQVLSAEQKAKLAERESKHARRSAERAAEKAQAN